MSPVLALRTGAEAVELVSSSCRACLACRRGFADHCVSPTEGHVVAAWQLPPGEVSLPVWAAEITAFDVLKNSGYAAPAVGLVGSGQTVELVQESLAAAGVLAAVAQTDPSTTPDAVETRRLSTLLREGGGGTGAPPDVVLAFGGSLGIAARLVRRGGAVAAVDGSDGAIAMSSLVQRELSVLIPHDRATTAAESPHLRVVGGCPRREEHKHG